MPRPSLRRGNSNETVGDDMPGGAISKSCPDGETLGSRKPGIEPGGGDTGMTMPHVGKSDDEMSPVVTATPHNISRFLPTILARPNAIRWPLSWFDTIDTFAKIRLIRSIV